MSKFADSPFGDSTIDNPFADPSVQQVTQGTINAQQGLDDYNPFDGGNVNSQNQQPAIMQAVPPPPSQLSNQPPPDFSTADFQRRQEELERKAEELARREAALNRGSTSRRNNWPPLPAFCPFEPCFYQDINVDIPTDFQKIVRRLYYLWMFHALVMVSNILGGLAIAIGTGELQVFGLGVLYFILLTPFSFLCWYRPIYKAFMSDSSFNFMVFFFIFTLQFVITTIQAVGFKGDGNCGIITTLSVFKSSIIVGILCLMVTIGFTVAAAADFLMITTVHRIYRSTGASMAKAQEEFTSEILQNQHVQGAASTMATAAVNSQLSSNRY